MSRDEIRLRHILDAIARTERYVEVGERQFLAESHWQDAVIRQLEIIGEATRSLSVDLRNRHPEIAWRRFAGLRDVLIHNYPGVELDVVWDVTQRAIPELERNVETILSEVADTRTTRSNR